MAESSPLIEAALAADPESMQLLVDRGADVKQSGAMALTMAVTRHCQKCVDLLVSKNLDKDAYTFTLLNVAYYAGVKDVAFLLDHGADVNEVDPLGHTALHYAAVSDLLLTDVVKLLIDRGAKVNVTSPQKQSRHAGMSALDIARMSGETPVVKLLLKAGGTATVRDVTEAKPQPAATLESAIQRSVPLLQWADAGFTAKSGCISCHNNSLAAMTVGLARKSGYGVDERIAAQQVKVNAVYLEHQRDALHQSFFPGQAGSEAFGDVFGPGVLGYLMVGLDAEHYQPDLDTDAAAMYLKSRQQLNGEWAYPEADTRQPV